MILVLQHCSSVVILPAPALDKAVCLLSIQSVSHLAARAQFSLLNSSAVGAAVAQADSRCVLSRQKCDMRIFAWVSHFTCDVLGPASLNLAHELLCKQGLLLTWSLALLSPLTRVTAKVTQQVHAIDSRACRSPGDVLQYCAVAQCT